MLRSHLSLGTVVLAVAASAACASQNDVNRTSCATDAECEAHQRCLETEVGLACVNVGGGVSYEGEVQPILATRCYSCHAPIETDEGVSYLSNVSSFRLDVYDDVNGVLGAHSMRDRILARSVDAAYHLDSIDQEALGDQELSDLLLSVMPPGVPLPVADREVLRAWVLAGGPRGGR